MERAAGSPTVTAIVTRAARETFCVPRITDNGDEGVGGVTWGMKQLSLKVARSSICARLEIRVKVLEKKEKKSEVHTGVGSEPIFRRWQTCKERGKKRSFKKEHHHYLRRGRLTHRSARQRRVRKERHLFRHEVRKEPRDTTTFASIYILLVFQPCAKN